MLKVNFFDMKELLLERYRGAREDLSGSWCTILDEITKYRQVQQAIESPPGKRTRKVGGMRTISVDVRVIALPIAI